MSTFYSCPCPGAHAPNSKYIGKYPPFYHSKPDMETFTLPTRSIIGSAICSLVTWQCHSTAFSQGSSPEAWTLRRPFTFPSSKRSVLSVRADFDVFKTPSLLGNKCQVLAGMAELTLVASFDAGWLVFARVQGLTRDESLDQPLHRLMISKLLGIVGIHPQTMTQDGSTTVNITDRVWLSSRLILRQSRGPKRLPWIPKSRSGQGTNMMGPGSSDICVRWQSGRQLRQMPWSRSISLNGC